MGVPAHRAEVGLRLLILGDDVDPRWNPDRRELAREQEEDPKRGSEREHSRFCDLLRALTSKEAK